MVKYNLRASCAMKTVSKIAEYLDKIGQSEFGDELMEALDVLTHGDYKTVIE